MTELNKVYINDVVISIPFDDYETQRKIVSDLYDKKKHGYVIKDIEVDDQSKCIIYREPNHCYN